MKLIAITALLLTLASGIGAGTARADTVINPDPTATNVSAFGSALVWSRQEAPNGKWRLVQHINGVTSDAPVRLSELPFNADLGPGRHGGIVAVYSRCLHGAPPRCDIFQLDLRSGRERKLRPASTSRCSETAPSIWKGFVVYARTGADPRCSRGLFVTTPRGRQILLWKAGGIGSRWEGAEVSETDMRGRTVAFETESGAGPSGETAIHQTSFSRRGGGRSCLLDGAATSGINPNVAFVRAPTLDAGFVYWTRTEWRVVPPRLDPDEGKISGFKRVRIGCRDAIQLARRHRTLVGPAAVNGGTLYYTGPNPYFVGNGVVGNGGVLRADDPPLSFAP